MITIFENFKREAEIGDWVICKPPSFVYSELKEFLNNNIGQLIRKNVRIRLDDGDTVEDEKVLIEYDNLPKNFNNVRSYSTRHINFSISKLKLTEIEIENSIWVDTYYIDMFGDKDDLEASIAMKEYNL